MPFEKGNTLSPGRPVGSVNKINQEIREMVREALELSGGVLYLVKQASENPVAFMGLISKIIPTDVKMTLDLPEARAYPAGLPLPVTIDNDATVSGLPASPEAVDSFH